MRVVIEQVFTNALQLFYNLVWPDFGNEQNVVILFMRVMKGIPSLISLN